MNSQGKEELRYGFVGVIHPFPFRSRSVRTGLCIFSLKGFRHCCSTILRFCFPPLTFDQHGHSFRDALFGKARVDVSFSCWHSHSACFAPASTGYLLVRVHVTPHFIRYENLIKRNPGCCGRLPKETLTIEDPNTLHIPANGQGTLGSPACVQHGAVITPPYENP